jgi:penicillin-binding protein 1C
MPVVNQNSQIANLKSQISNRQSQILSPAAIWLTYEALRRVNRPETETGWQYFGSAPEVAWKTGTSFGYRDAWAIGTTPSHVVAVWAGNADGEGRPGLSGITSAAPLLFDIIRLLPPSASWFTRPEEGMTLASLCAASGFRAGPDCPETREEWIPETGLRSDACPYHTVVTLDTTETYRVNSTCASPREIVKRSWFILPPAMEYYYRMRNPAYRTPPPFRKGCSDDMQVPAMEFIYPPRDARIFIPRSLQGQMMSMLPEIAHRRRNAKVYWHLDNNYIGMTDYLHQTEIRVGEGEHVITAVDEEGMTVSRKFFCIGTL